MAENTNYGAPEVKTKVTQGKVQIDKPKVSKRIVNFLLSDKLDSIGNYLAYAILGPNLKDLVFKLGMGALQMGLYGGNVTGMPNQGGNYVPGYGYQPVRRDPVPYNQISSGMYGGGYGYAQPQPGPFQGNRGMSLTDISFDTKDDAYRILDRMTGELRRYGKVRVADFYIFAGITGQESNWALQGTGWYSLDGATATMRTDGRWIINFPPVQNL